MDIGNVIWNPTDKCWHLFPEINFHTDIKEKKTFECNCQCKQHDAVHPGTG